MVIILTIVFAYFFLFYFGYKLFMNLRKRQHLPIRDSEQRNSNSSENAVDVASKNEKGANIFVPSKKSSSEDFHSAMMILQRFFGTRICAAPNAELDFEGKIDMSPLFLSAVSLVFEQAGDRFHAPAPAEVGLFLRRKTCKSDGISWPCRSI